LYQVFFRKGENMKTVRILVVATTFFAIGFLAASIWAKTQKVDPATFLGKEPKAAAAALLSAAEVQAGDGSWELIAVGRIYYLSGDKAKGQIIFDKVAKVAKKEDWERIAKVYMEAREWDKAEPVLQKVLTLAQDDDSGQALLGSFYNLQGQRGKAEELFSKSLKKGDSVWNTLDAAASYLGIQPY
jgi:tetratricopeptide (TPR) repeat protein